jgi:hypothetical protein
MRITTDYLVIGAGASGLAFADTLAAESDAEIVLVDRRKAPGGHWVDAYPFVALHSPSAFYGVNSLALGGDRIDETGPNAGLYERARKDEILAYYAEVVSRLEATGRVRVLLDHDHLGGDRSGQRLRDRASGELVEVDVRRRVVDARYLETAVPATHRPSFEVAADARFVPVGGLPDAAAPATTYAVLGAGKTAVDACLWLLEHDVDPERIVWVRPRDAWFHDRLGFQPLDLVVGIMEGLAADAEAAALASDTYDFFDRLEDAGRMVRVDAGATTSMYRGGMLSGYELDQLRRVPEVVRLGRVRRIEADRLLLDDGELPTGPGVLHVDCTARGLRDTTAMPIFAPGRIVLQQVRHNSPTFNAALIAFVEARREDDEDKNRLCPAHPYAGDIHGYPRLLARTWRTEGSWLGEPDLARWVATSRLNLLSAFEDHKHEARAVDAVTRYLTHVGDAIQNLESFSGR